jgi:hypothetical protein
MSPTWRLPGQPGQQRPLFAPPDDELPGMVPLELALVHDDRRVTWITAAANPGS